MGEGGTSWAGTELELAPDATALQPFPRLHSQPYKLQPSASPGGRLALALVSKCALQQACQPRVQKHSRSGQTQTGPGSGKAGWLHGQSKHGGMGNASMPGWVQPALHTGNAEQQTALNHACSRRASPKSASLASALEGRPLVSRMFSSLRSRWMICKAPRCIVLHECVTAVMVGVMCGWVERGQRVARYS